MDATAPFLVPALRVSGGALVWAVHFVVVYAFAALACASRFDARAVPWVITAASVVAAAVLARMMLRLRGATHPAFVDWLSGVIAALAMIAVVWEAASALAAPACT
jgi:hypothetical protein